MAKADSFQLSDALEDLLDKERAALMTGALADMGRIAGKKDQLLKGPALGVPDPKTLDRLRRKAARNQRLLSAAIAGIRTVTARLDALRSELGTLNTYDHKGQRKVLTCKPRSGLERRA